MINDGLKSAEAKQSLAKFNVEPNITSPEGFGAFLERYRAGLAIEQAAVDAI